MKKIFCKIFVATIAVLSISILSATSFIGVAAEEPVVTVTSQTSINSGEVITPKGGDVIVTKYRRIDGKIQYRRWNETRNCWVDSDWIDL